MKKFKVTSKIEITVPHVFSATEDKDADFNQVVLRVRSDSKFVDFVVSDLGDTVTIDLWDKMRKGTTLKLRNEEMSAQAFQIIMENHLR